MKSKLEIIEETVEYYSEDTSRRASYNGDCVFFDITTGNMCAVGRCLSNPKDVKHQFGGVTPSILERLKDDYKGHEIGFWVELQELHDENCNWTDSGLSLEGEDFVEYIKAVWL